MKKGIGKLRIITLKNWEKGLKMHLFGVLNPKNCESLSLYQHEKTPGQDPDPIKGKSGSAALHGLDQ